MFRVSSGLRFGSSMRWWFHGVFGTLLASGVLWLIVSHVPGAGGGLGREGAWVRPWLLKIHGAAAMASLLILGMLIPVHMQRAWAQGKNRATAVFVVAVTALLIATGYGLYYAGDETWRGWISDAHDAAGCVLPLALLGHVALGRRRQADARALGDRGVRAAHAAPLRVSRRASRE
jgi:cation transport ATPase